MMNIVVKHKTNDKYIYINLVKVNYMTFTISTLLFGKDNKQSIQTYANYFKSYKDLDIYFITDNQFKNLEKTEVYFRFFDQYDYSSIQGNTEYAENIVKNFFCRPDIEIKQEYLSDLELFYESWFKYDDIVIKDFILVFHTTTDDTMIQVNLNILDDQYTLNFYTNYPTKFFSYYSMAEELAYTDKDKHCSFGTFLLDIEKETINLNSYKKVEDIMKGMITRYIKFIDIYNPSQLTDIKTLLGLKNNIEVELSYFTIAGLASDMIMIDWKNLNTMLKRVSLFSISEKLGKDTIKQEVSKLVLLNKLQNKTLYLSVNKNLEIYDYKLE